MQTYQHKTIAEAELQIHVNNAHLQPKDFEALFWELWGACAESGGKAWTTFEFITKTYLDDRSKKNGN